MADFGIVSRYVGAGPDGRDVIIGATVWMLHNNAVVWSVQDGTPASITHARLREKCAKHAELGESLADLDEMIAELVRLEQWTPVGDHYEIYDNHTLHLATMVWGKQQ